MRALSTAAAPAKRVGRSRAKPRSISAHRPEPAFYPVFLFRGEEVRIKQPHSFSKLGLPAKTSNFRRRVRKVEPQQERRRVHSRIDPFLAAFFEPEHRLIKPHMARVDLDQKVRAQPNAMRVDIGDVKDG